MTTTNLLIVGLGNPGKKYEPTRHNIGERALAYWLQQKNLTPDWKAQPSAKSLLAKVKVENTTVRLLKPQTFMNESGLSVAEVMKFFKLNSNQLLIINDEVDLPFGAIRPSWAASAAGHKGVQSIIDNLATDKFWRLRIGIGRPATPQPLEDYVLQTFNATDKIRLNQVLDIAGNFISIFIGSGKLENTTVKV